ncbi:integrase [Parabacteroides sp. PFB2-12]|uniref:tyrosine-type recombinase/integrase n=1 Tax=unclassified Parabacteroides TaxID=2649774 RepID=UPI0024764165|nr:MULTISPECIES: site-specific integrase [unclassified Parabacteroides]MDH6343764.1 integrase [Parabacteroides sp. PM6-13]MDH6391926.1 integrase [Parabacteroides sp. PFB2-12]
MNTGRIRVHLRERDTKKGISLYLDFYPGIRDPKTNKIKRRESLGIYLYKKPKNEREKEFNKEARAHAEAIRDKYSLALFCEDSDIYDKSKLKADFLSYFYSVAKEKGDKWTSVYFYFDRFMNSKCSFGEIDENLCERFRDYLTNTYQLKNNNTKLSINSAAAYYRLFRSLLKRAYKEKWLKTNLNDFIDGIKEKSTHREYLTLEELRKLAETPCKHSILRNAAIFAALTGLRRSDILSIKWKHIQPSAFEEGGYDIRKNILKVNKDETLPLNPEALDFCGDRKGDEDLIFKGLKKAWMDKPFKAWVKSTGINRNITFHSLRHTNATLLLASGVQLSVIRDMLTHSKIQTTEIYAKTNSIDKRNASKIISLKREEKVS